MHCGVIRNRGDKTSSLPRDQQHAPLSRMMIGQLFGALADQTDHQRCPAGLVTGTEPFAGLGVEVLVKQQQIPPTAVFPIRNPCSSVKQEACKARRDFCKSEWEGRWRGRWIKREQARAEWGRTLAKKR